MARKAREKSQSGIYHIVVAGEKKQKIFLDNKDKEKFLSLLTEYQDVCGFKLYAYALVEDHIHLLLNECDSAVARIMTRIGTSYVHWFNSKYERNGTLFSDRFKSQVIDGEEDFKKTLLYIHNECKDFVSYQLYFTNKIIVSDMARRIFGGVLEFEQYHQGIPQPCLDVKAKAITISDEDLTAFISKEFGIFPTEIMEKSQEKATVILLTLLKYYSIPLRQLARITNISTSKIWRYTSKAVT